MSNRVSASPMEVVVRLDCVGILDIEKFTEAILAELKRQPLLQANAVVGQTHRRSYWQPASNCTPVIRWFEEDPDKGRGFPEDFAPIDLENEIGFRVYGWRFPVNDQPRVVMKFLFHHACCDGKGAIGFIEHTFYRYHALLENQSQSATPSGLAVVDEQQILRRNLPAANKLSVVDRIWYALVIRPKRVAKMLLSKPRLFSEKVGFSNDGDQSIFTDPLRLCTTELSVEETKQLGVLARKLSATSNTILVRELFHVLTDCFNSDSILFSDHRIKSEVPAVSRRSRDLRILIPFSLRDQRTSRMPGANCVSMVYLEANEKLLKADSHDDPVLVSDLVRQMSFIRRWNLQYSWPESIELYAKVWPIIKLFKFRRGNRFGNMAPIATTVMTNLGRSFSDSDLINSHGELAVKSLVVKSVHVAPPCNATVVVNFSINFYGNRLTLDINYLPALLTQETAERILESWKRRILDSLAGFPLDG